MCAEELATCYRLTCVLPKRCPQTPVHQNVTVFGKRVFTEVIKLKSFGWCPYKKGEIWTEEQTDAEERLCEETRGEGSVNAGGMLP